MRSYLRKKSQITECGGRPLCKQTRRAQSTAHTRIARRPVDRRAAPATIFSAYFFAAACVGRLVALSRLCRWEKRRVCNFDSIDDTRCWPTRIDPHRIFFTCIAEMFRQTLTVTKQISLLKVIDSLNFFFFLFVIFSRRARRLTAANDDHCHHNDRRRAFEAFRASLIRFHFWLSSIFLSRCAAVGAASTAAAIASTMSLLTVGSAALCVDFQHPKLGHLQNPGRQDPQGAGAHQGIQGGVRRRSDWQMHC